MKYRKPSTNWITYSKGCCLVTQETHKSNVPVLDGCIRTLAVPLCKLLFVFNCVPQPTMSYTVARWAKSNSIHCRQRHISVTAWDAQSVLMHVCPFCATGFCRFCLCCIISPHLCHKTACMNDSHYQHMLTHPLTDATDSHCALQSFCMCPNFWHL